MKLRAEILFFLVLIIPCTLTAQRYISGRITDAANNETVPGVAVVISNTTRGTITDSDGYYQLSIPGEGAYRLAISHVGYQSVFHDIEPGISFVEFDIALQINELEEVMVTAKVRPRRRDINLFWRTVLGKDPSRRTIQATNPEAVYYFYNRETQKLSVSCNEPLQIINSETGYQIQYLLNFFTHDYTTGYTDWSYQYHFTELEPANPRQKNNWEKKRQALYPITLETFIRSLYNNSLYDNGFVLATLHQDSVFEKSFQISLLSPDSILSPKSADNSKMLNLANEQVLLLCFGRPVTSNDLNILQLTQGRDFMLRSDLLKNLLGGDSIRIFPDGTYTNLLRMAPVNSSNTLLGLTMRLPLDYFPEGLGAIQTENENDIDFEDIVQYFETQLNYFPQEKLHLHTDRNFYVPGEKIWFKAYLTDAFTHQYPTFSQYIYVELISPNDSLVGRVMIRPENDMFSGYLFLSEIIPEGNYTLRAYTRAMENLGDDYFFKKNIQIGTLMGGNSAGADLQSVSDTYGNSAHVTNPREQRGKNQDNSGKMFVDETLAVAQDDYDVSFFPEGGNLVEGAFCKVAFKALKSDGTSEIISGELVDENDSTVTSIQTFHAGTGVFSYIPLQGKTYFLKCANENGFEKQFALPQPDPRACTLTVTQRNKRISVSVRKPSTSQDLTFYLLAQCRGMAVYFRSWDGAKEFESFSEEDLPAGIIQFVLFDEQMNPLSERLVFNKNELKSTVEFHTDKTEYEKREQVVATLSFSDIDPLSDGIYNSFLEENRNADSIGNAVAVQHGNLSIAITDDADIAVDSTTTIFSSLLLSSELKGYIENPAYYLEENPASEIALDHLMMTHGWRRYAIPQVVKGNLMLPAIPFQVSQQISGQVISQSRSRPVQDTDILITVKDGGYDFVSIDADGKFLLQDFEYPDSTSYLIQVLGNSEGNSVELVLDQELFPELIHAPQSLSTAILKSYEEKPNDSTPLGEGRGVADAFIEKAELRSQYDADMRIVHLNEFEITARRIERQEEPRLEYFANTGSDFTVRKENFEKQSLTFVSEMLRGVPGVNISSNGLIQIRQSQNLQGIQPPLVLIDGIAHEWPKPEAVSEESLGGISVSPQPVISPYDSPLEMVNVNDVESIDIFRGSNAAIFGARGAGGVISITTKRGPDNRESSRQNFNYTTYTPLGYQKPVEFYAPKYETLEAKYLTIPDYRSTIFWKPDIVISDAGEVTFDFYTSDYATTYSVVIEGITTSGQIIRQVEKIRVR